MVEFVGFTRHEETLIRGLVDRFRADDYRMCELARVEKAEMAGYNGRVVPRQVEGGRLDMTMYLSSCNAFTVAHELAHVSDIAVRRAETVAHLSHDMPAHWHLAHRMSSEYYANRVACEYAGEAEIFGAFRGDATGLVASARRQDWASFLVDYSLLLGIVHAKGRRDCPLKLVAPVGELPEAVASGARGFMHQAVAFFDGYGAHAQAA